MTAEGFKSVTKQGYRLRAQGMEGVWVVVQCGNSARLLHDIPA